MASPFSNFTPTFDDQDCLELVWENGQILTRGRSGRTRELRSSGCNGGSIQNGLIRSILDLYQTAYSQDLKQNTTNGLNKNLGGTQVGENPCPPCQKIDFPERSDKMRKKLNFSMFLKPFESAVVETANDSNVMMMGHKQEHNFPPDEQSAVVERSGDVERSDELRVASSSMCSHEASNYPNSSLTWKYDDEEIEEETIYLSDNSEEETDEAKGKVPARKRIAAKRKRSAEIHSFSERKRRDSINKRMRALQELLPHCNKVEDKASILDEAIESLKTLQLQVKQMMSMMLPLAHYPPIMGLGMGMGMHLGSQFLQSPVSGLTDRSVLVPIPYSSCFSSFEGSSAHFVQLPPMAAATAFPAQLQKYASLSSLNDAVHKSNQEMANNRMFNPFSQVMSENPKHFVGQARK